MHSGEPQQVAPPDSLEESAAGVKFALFSGQVGGVENPQEDTCIIITASGAVFTGKPTLKQWRAGLKALRHFRTSADLITADFVRTGWEFFGMSVVNESLVQLEFDLIDAKRAIAIASLAPTVERAGLTSNHLIAIADAALLELQQSYWARMAVEHRLTVQELRRSITAGEIRKGPALPPPGSGRSGKPARHRPGGFDVAPAGGRSDAAAGIPPAPSLPRASRSSPHGHLSGPRP